MAKATDAPGRALDGAALNVVVLAGRLTRPAAARTLASGERLVAYEVAAGEGERGSGSVPVVWPDPPAAAEGLGEGVAVVVVGRVRRRFFKAGGTTQSRTEVVAEAVVPARQAKRAAAAVERARRRLGPPS